MMIRPATMWRAFFCALGIMLMIMGIECLLIDSAILVQTVAEEPMQQQGAIGGFFNAPQTQNDRIFRPSEWFPWSLLACGAIVFLYAVSLRRNNVAMA